jgi:hypothetical protein
VRVEGLCSSKDFSRLCSTNICGIPHGMAHDTGRTQDETQSCERVIPGCRWSDVVAGNLASGAIDPAAVYFLRVRPEAGTRIVMGFDGSLAQDSTALIGWTMDEVPHRFTLGLWERPKNAPADWRIPRPEVDAAVWRAFRDFDVVMLVADPAYWQTEIEAWDAEFELMSSSPSTPARTRPWQKRSSDTRSAWLRDCSLTMATPTYSATSATAPHVTSVVASSRPRPPAPRRLTQRWRCCSATGDWPGLQRRGSPYPKSSRSRPSWPTPGICADDANLE